MAGRAGIAAQVAGAFTGVAAAHLMFGGAIFSASRHARSGAAQMFSEFVATFGLLCVIWGCARLRSSAVPFAVGAYSRGFIGSPHPHISPILPSRSRGRQVTPLQEIRPADAPGFIVAQLGGATAATILFRWLV